jgi:hypothetical protein
MGKGAGVVLAAGAVAMALACSSSSGGGGSGSDGGSGVLFACMEPDGSFCTQIYGPPSSMSAEQQACSVTMGKLTEGPCPMTGVIGCCIDPGGVEEQCSYNATAAINEGLCKNKGGTWVGPDGGPVGEAGATGPSAFVGTWARSGSQTVMCPGGTTTTMITGDLVIALGSASNTIAGTQPDGCVTTYTVSGNVASATAGEMCSVTTEGGVAETITTQSHTLTLSADGTTITSTSSDTIDKTATMTMCSATASGTLTKM